MLIIGIDPGISGSICFFKDGKILDVIELTIFGLIFICIFKLGEIYA